MTSHRIGDELPGIEHTPQTVDLFRYSAATWNAHRVHYDEPYARDEGHPGVLVHSHFRAALALRCVTEGLGAEHLVVDVDYRVRRPATAGQRLTYGARVAEVDGDRTVWNLVEHVDGAGPGLEGRATTIRKSQD